MSPNNLQTCICNKMGRFLLTRLILFFVLMFHLWDYQYFDIYTIDYAISYFVITYFIFRYIHTSGILSLEVFFNVFGLLYSNFYISQLISLNQQISSNIGFAMFLSHLAILFFNVSFIIFGFKRNTSAKVVGNKYDLHTQNVLLTFFLILCVVTEIYVIFKQIGIVTYFEAERGGKALMMSNYSSLTFYKFGIPLVSVVSLYNYLYFKNRYDLILFLISFFFALFNSVLSASRAELISLFLPILFLFNYFGKIKERTVVIIGIMAVVLFGVWKSLFWGEFKLSYDSEFNTWYEICDNVLKNPDRKLLYGESYLTTLYNIVIPFTDSQTLSTWYLENYEWEVLARGGGRGFSAVLEAYMNFDILGIFFLYCFYGWLIGRLNTNTTFNTFIYLIVMTSLFQFFRSESYSLWKNMMWFKIYPLTIIFFISKRIR